MDLEIRLANVKDKEEIIQLQSNSLRVLASKNYRPEQIESLVRSQARARFYSEVVFVAIYREKIVGFASLLVHKSQIGGVYVNPEFSRQGIGSRLLEVVENAAIEKDYKLIYVCSSLTAIKFYRKQGYRVYSNSVNSGFFSEDKVWIPCKILKKRLIEVEPKEGAIELTETEKINRRVLILTIALIIVVSVAIALL